MAYHYPLNGGRLNASVNTAGNTAGAAALISTGTLHLAGGNNITLSQNQNSITISGAAGGGGSVNFSAGTTSGNLGSVQFANSNGISWGLNGSAITGTVATNYAASTHSHGNPTLNLTNLNGTTASASNGLTLSLSAAAQSVQTQGVQTINIGGNTAGATASISSGALSLYGGNNITLSQNVNSVTISGAAGGASPDATMWFPYNEGVNVVGQVGNGSLGFTPVPTPGHRENVAIDRVVFPLYFTNASNSIGTLTVSMYMGLYTRISTNISLVHSQSTSASLGYSNNVNSANQRGIRLLSMGWTTTIDDNRYIVGIFSRSTTAGTNASLSQVLVSQMNSNVSGMWDAASASSVQWPLGIGFYSATTSALPGTVAYSQIYGTNSLAARPPSWHMINGTV